MNAPPHPYDLIGAELRALADQEGADLWRNRYRLTGLLLDHQPELRREIRAIASAVEQGVARALAETERSLAAIAIDRQASLVETEIGLRPEVALNVTRAIAHALDLGPLPSVYGQGGPPRSDPRPSSPQPVHRPQPAYAPPRQQPGWSDPVSSQPRSVGPYAPEPAAGARFPWRIAIVGSAVAAALMIVMVSQFAGGGGQQVAGNSPPAAGYAGELIDFGVAAQSTLRPDVGSPTPLQIPVGRRVTTHELNELIAAEPRLLLVDVLANAHPQTIARAQWIPAAGLPGEFTDSNQTGAKIALDRAAGNDMTRPVVFFCMGARCWESYNAVLRAATMGYTNLYWYRGGLEAWQAAGLPMQSLGGGG